jgi:putative nucleotidyltransferase with HDIG domain
MTKKPCAPGPDTLASYLDAVQNLPPTPTLMVRLIELFRQSEHDVDEIVGLMKQDPSVTAEVLRRCNSSFFGNEEPVLDVFEAVFRLGFYEVYRITVALFGMRALSASKINKSLEVESLWRHSAMTAVAGGAIARELGESEGIAFTAGLLHDVGKIVLASAEGPKYAKVLQVGGQNGVALKDAETAAFGFNHAEVGARLLARWGLPEPVCVPVLGHHDASWPEPFERTAAIVALANLLARCIEKNGSDKQCELPEAIHAMELLKLQPTDMTDLEVQARSDMKRLSSLVARSAPQ